MASISTINFLTSQHIHQLDAQVAGLEEALTQIGNRLVDALIDLEAANGWQAQTTIRQIAWIQSQLRGQLNMLGWDELAGRFVNGYDEAALFGRQILEAIGHPSAQLVPMRADTIQNLRALDLAAFNEHGNQMIRVLSRELAYSTLVGKRRSDCIRSMTKAMDGQVKQATVFIDTSLRAFDRTVNMQLWDEAGIERFRFYGPADNVTRPFCAGHVGKTYTLFEIKRMSNGSARFGNVLVYGGGPRCRHTWSPISNP